MARIRGLVDGTQDSQLVGTIGEPLAGQREAGDAQEDQREPEQRRVSERVVGV